MSPRNLFQRQIQNGLYTEVAPVQKQIDTISHPLHTWKILPYMAVFESVHRTVDLSSFMGTVSMFKN